MITVVNIYFKPIILEAMMDKKYVYKIKEEETGKIHTTINKLTKLQIILSLPLIVYSIFDYNLIIGLNMTLFLPSLLATCTISSASLKTRLCDLRSSCVK